MHLSLKFAGSREACVSHLRIEARKYAVESFESLLLLALLRDIHMTTYQDGYGVVVEVQVYGGMERRSVDVKVAPVKLHLLAPKSDPYGPDDGRIL